MEDEKGFTVRDRRIDHDGAAAPRSAPAEPPPSEAAEAAAAAAEPAGETGPDEGPAGPSAAEAEGVFSMAGEGPAIDFSAFVFSLARTALIHLGLESHPETGQAERNLQAARETIDVLGMLEEKTRGNLTPEESELIAKMLYTLRLSFVEVSRTGRSG